MTIKNAFQWLVSKTRKIVMCSPGLKCPSTEDLYETICEKYGKLHPKERYRYVCDVASLHHYNHEKLHSLLSRDTTSEALRVRRLYSMKESLQPHYRDFFINLGRVPNGIKLLVDLRSDIMDIQQRSTKVGEPSIRLINSESTGSTKEYQTQSELSTPTFLDHHSKFLSHEEDTEKFLSHILTPEVSSNLYVLNAELKDLITVWFSGGICKLERITWDSPCRLLQKISELEAVHPIKGWIDIKQRVGPNRRCYVFTHLCMPNEPIVILHTALCSKIPSSIREIVARKFSRLSDEEREVEDSSKIHSAIFYSISSPYKGLTGVDLGNTLIKRVVQQLQFEFPNIHEFCTLSPVPGFRKWLSGEIQSGLSQEVNSRILGNDSSQTYLFSRVLTSKQIDFLNDYFQTTNIKDLLTILDIHLGTISTKYSSVVNLVDLEGASNREFEIMSWFLKIAAVKYLCVEKYRGYALDTVCNFHLKNGAVLWRINWMADPSPRGIQNSYGVMVNYRYFFENTDKFSENYLENKEIEMSEDVKKLLDDVLVPVLN